VSVVQVVLQSCAVSGAWSFVHYISVHCWCGKKISRVFTYIKDEVAFVKQKFKLIGQSAEPNLQGKWPLNGVYVCVGACATGGACHTVRLDVRQTWSQV